MFLSGVFPSQCGKLPIKQFLLNTSPSIPLSENGSDSDLRVNLCFADLCLSCTCVFQGVSLKLLWMVQIAVQFLQSVLCWFEPMLCICSSGVRLILLQLELGHPLFGFTLLQLTEAFYLCTEKQAFSLSLICLWCCAAPKLGLFFENKQKISSCVSYFFRFWFNQNLSVYFSEYSIVVLYLSRDLSCNQSEG